jgi:hypothetical protein
MRRCEAARKFGASRGCNVPWRRSCRLRISRRRQDCAVSRAGLLRRVSFQRFFLSVMIVSPHPGSLNPINMFFLLEPTTDCGLTVMHHDGATDARDDPSAVLGWDGQPWLNMLSGASLTSRRVAAPVFYRRTDFKVLHFGHFTPTSRTSAEWAWGHRLNWVGITRTRC